MTVPLDLFPDTVRITPGNRLAIGGCDLVDLAEQFGTPLYIYDSATILARAMSTSAANSRPTTAAFNPRNARNVP